MSTAMVEMTTRVIAVPARIRMKIARGFIASLPYCATRNLSTTNQTVKEVGYAPRTEENGADQPFGEQVLDEHFVNRGNAQVRVQRIFAEAKETVERLDKPRIVLVRVNKLGHESAGEIRHALLKILDSLVEVLVSWRGVGEEEVEKVNQLLGLREISHQRNLVILVEVSPPRVFKDGVCEWVALRDLLLGLRFKVVLSIYRAPAG